jgi:photosystem II stability/assembly factor-like uncharacterized protein
MTTQLERELRALLAERAADVRGADELAERILAAGKKPLPPPAPTPNRWRVWIAPLLASAAVVAVVAAVLVGQNWGTSGKPASPGPVGTPTARVSPSSPTPTQTHHTAPVVPPPTTRHSSPSGPPPSTSSAAVLRFRDSDLSWVGENTGFALGSARCGASRCAVLLATTDGAHWAVRNRSLPFGPPAVSGLRFADSQVGYAYGPQALYLTKDGGRSWRRETGGAIALETSNGTVIRVTSTGTGCPGPCNVRVLVAKNGSSAWTPAPLPTPNGATGGDGVAFSRNGDEAVLANLGHPAGGATDAHATLFLSHDAGRTWTSRADPCPQRGGSEVDTITVLADPGGVVTVGCAPRSGAAEFVAVSRDGGTTFTPASGRTAQLPYGDGLAGSPDGLLLAGQVGQPGGPPLAQSTDGGGSWHAAPVSGSLTWLGAESDSVARAVTDRRVLWTTYDDGRHWAAQTFP